MELDGHFGPVMSNTGEIKRGVPQGSILGPLLFNLFMVDLEKHVKHCKFHSYADDVQLLMSFDLEDTEGAFDQINEDLQGILQWSLHNGIKVNIDKTDAIIFGSRRRKRLTELILSGEFIIDF